MRRQLVILVLAAAGLVPVTGGPVQLAGWRAPAPTPRPTPLPTPRPVPPSDWDAAWCSVITSIAEVDSDVVRMVRAAGRDAAGTVGYWAGSLMWDAVWARNAIADVPDWGYGRRAVSAAWRLVERADTLVSESLAVFLDVRPFNRAVTGYERTGLRFLRELRKLRELGVTCA